jgi:hypothetical protein
MFFSVAGLDACQMEALRSNSTQQNSARGEASRPPFHEMFSMFDMRTPAVNNAPMPDLRQLVPLPFRTTRLRGPTGRRLSPLARELIVVLVVKALVLYALWFAFFRTPAAPGMTMDTVSVEQRLVTPVSHAQPAHGR